MKCPNCGAEMKDGCLYCEECGEDIHMVPDFEPELEMNMEESLEQIRQDVVVEDEEDDFPDYDEERLTTFGKIVRIIIGCICLIIAIAIGVSGMRIYHHYSVDYQVGRAQKAAEKQQYENAIAYYNRAIELDMRNVSLKLDLAEVYLLDNNPAEYEQLLIAVVNDPFTDAEQLESAYGKLIAIYREKGDYQTINDMLLQSGNESIKSVYQGYLAQPPQFSLPAGNYDEVETLKLNVTETGVIYYTTNGKLPDKFSEVYTAPIVLEDGDHIIHAMFVNERGVNSEIVSAEYHIDVEQLDAPELNVDSGDYVTPVFITVTSDPEEVYYTTNGKDPTPDSTRYNGPIPMPLGVSTFRFVKYEAGNSSRIVEKTFNLKLDTDLTSDQAVKKIVEYAIENGKILDNEGHYDETAAAYLYQFQYAIHINDVLSSSDFYVVAEVFSDAQGISVKTGNYFAVDVYTGYFYKLQMENGSYTLVEI